MNRCMATGRPARSHLQKRRVVCVAYINVARRNIWTLRLRVAAQAKIGIVINEHLLVDGTVRVMAVGAGDFAFEDGMS